MQDNGKGVILAATWILPLLIIPRAWDYHEVAGDTDHEVVGDTARIAVR
jgi:hypothetical protein